MTLFLIFFLAGALVVLQVAILGTLLRGLARWRELELSTRRAFKIAVGITVVSVAYSVAYVWADAEFHWSSRSDWAPLIALLLNVAILWWAYRHLLNTTWRRSAVVGLGATVGASALSFAIAFIVRTLFIEAFISPAGGMAMAVLGRHIDLTCDNCAYTWPIAAREDRFGALHVDEEVPCPICANRVAPPVRPPIYNGDRIILFKRTLPKRWDLAVFDTPEEPSTKYIKRLVGLPGETIEIAAGDLFASGERLRKDPLAHEDLWFLVHDTQFIPANPLPDGPRWTSDNDASGWRNSENGWNFDHSAGDRGAIQFVGFIDDRVPYNGDESKYGVQPEPVLDIRLDCRVKVMSGGGSLIVRWNIGEIEVEAVCKSDGNVSLNTQVDGTDKTVTGTGFYAGPVRFVVRDGVAYLLQDTETLASIVFDDRSADEFFAATPRMPGQLTIGAADCNLEIGQLTIFRDVHYRRADDIGFGRQGPYTLGDDQHFLMGDNSAASKDCRFIGPITRGAINGVVICRYWPPKRWHAFD